MQPDICKNISWAYGNNHLKECFLNFSKIRDDFSLEKKKSNLTAYLFVQKFFLSAYYMLGSAVPQ